MIEPPSCQNNKCENYNKIDINNVSKVKNKRNTFICYVCKKEFKWSIPKAPKGAIL